MLEICKRHAYTTHGQVKLGICVSVLFITAMVFGLMVLAQPYAVYATGEKVSEPWSVKVSGQEVAVVESIEAGEAVIAGVKAAYIKDVSEQKQSDVGGEVSIEKYQFIDATKHPVVMTAAEAVEHIIKLTASGKDSPIAIETKEVVEETEVVPFDTETVESYQHYEGRTGVLTEGADGENRVVSEVTMVNGKEVARKTLSVEVLVEPVTQVEYTGTYPKTQPNTGSKSSARRGGGSVTYNAPASQSGQSVANFACQFVGNPYVYGGTSLTNGADCSGFTMAVYGAFGVSLPRTSYAQEGVGISVPYSEAQPGDLVCYGSHVGIYIGGGQIVHASTPSGGIRIGSINYRPYSSIRRII